MLNWFDLMRQAQGGAGFDNMARQFGLSTDEVQRAVAAVLPAFMMGFQRQAMNPAAAMQLFQTMGSGSYPSFFDSAAQAFSPKARQEGEALLDRLFGSNEVSRQVADQAARFSGVGTEVLNQLLPLTAAILAGGLAKMMTSQGAMLGPMAEAWRGAMPGQAPSPGQTGAIAWTDLWSSWMQMALGTDASAPTKPSTPFNEMMESFFRFSAGEKVEETKTPRNQGKAGAKPKKAEPKARGRSSASSSTLSWDTMMETGLEMQRQHLESLQQIVNAAWGQPQGKR